MFQIHVRVYVITVPQIWLVPTLFNAIVVDEYRSKL